MRERIAGHRRDSVSVCVCVRERIVGHHRDPMAVCVCDGEDSGPP